MFSKLFLLALPALTYSMPFSLTKSSPEPCIQSGPLSCSTPDGASHYRVRAFSGKDDDGPYFHFSPTFPYDLWRKVVSSARRQKHRKDVQDDYDYEGMEGEQYDYSEYVPLGADDDWYEDEWYEDDMEDEFYDSEDVLFGDDDDYNFDYKDGNWVEENNYFKPIGRGKCVSADGKVIDCSERTLKARLMPEMEQEELVATGYEGLCKMDGEVVPCVL